MIALSIKDLETVYPEWGQSLSFNISRAAETKSYVDLTTAVQGLYALTQPTENLTQWNSEQQETMRFRIQPVVADWENPNGPYWLGIK